MKRSKSGKKINFWKWAFLLLLALQFAIMALVWFRVTAKRESVPQIETSTKSQIQIGTLTSSREQLNEAVAAYLKDYQSGSFSYQVYATETQIVFEGIYEILGSEIPLYIYFSPSRDENGAVVLEVLEVSAGTLSLPTADILSYVAKNYTLPKAIQIDAKEEKILVDLPNLPNTLGLSIQAKVLDLYNNQLVFDLFRKNA